MKIRSFILIFVILTLAPVACAREVELRDRVLGFVDTSEGMTRQFSYVESREDKELANRVKGAVADSFRYRAMLTVGESPVLEQVVDDDALAVKVHDPSQIPSLAAGTTPSSQIIVDALNRGEWVVDPSGAPPFRRSAEENITGVDPIFDAVWVFRYIASAIEAAASVDEWQKEDIDPAYRPAEDRFPPPDEDAGERRFDLRRPSLPTGAGAGLDQLPIASHFRRMAIYVQKGKIVKVMEDIDIDGHYQVVRAREEKRERLLEIIKATKEQVGNQKIVQRKMDVRFTDYGEEFDVRQPEGAIVASLDGIFALPADGTEAGGGQGTPPEEQPATEPQEQPTG